MIVLLITALCFTVTYLMYSYNADLIYTADFSCVCVIVCLQVEVICTAVLISLCMCVLLLMIFGVVKKEIKASGK